MKKALSLVLTLAMIIALAAVGGTAHAADRVSITIFNSKTEIQEYLEEAAAEYSDSHDVDIEVYYSQDTVAAHLSTRYASGDPYTINMVDAKDVYSLGATYGYDMSGEEWVADTDYAISVDGKVVGFPVCVEARGILYNADAIQATLGEEFDPDSIIDWANVEPNAPTILPKDQAVLWLRRHRRRKHGIRPAFSPLSRTSLIR